MAASAIRVTSQNILAFMIEIFSIKIDLAPPVISFLFERKKYSQEIMSERERIVYFGLELLSLSSQITLNKLTL